MLIIKYICEVHYQCKCTVVSSRLKHTFVIPLSFNCSCIMQRNLFIITTRHLIIWHPQVHMVNTIVFESVSSDNNLKQLAGFFLEVVLFIPINSDQFHLTINSWDLVTTPQWLVTTLIYVCSSSWLFYLIHC